jgi:carboxymethylenebutenolidase
VVLYEGAGHAFMNDTRPEAFRPEIAANAWGRTLDFFRSTLA